MFLFYFHPFCCVIRKLFVSLHLGIKRIICDIIMNISYNWLKRYINLPDNAEETAKALTSIGLEVGTVEKIETVKGGLRGLVIGEVLTCVPHENSDHLHVTTVTVGAEPLQIVCGAPNVAAGQKVVVATLGTTLYDGDQEFVIKKSKIRGVESFGMLCAEDEIGVGTSHDGIMVLPQDTPAGMEARDYFHIEDDYLIEVDITPNRSDAVSHYGVARDLYAYYAARMGANSPVVLTKPAVDSFRTGKADYTPIRVEVKNADACPRYSGLTIAGVTVGESPDWLKNALLAIGLRPINNVVDVTNFVLHEMGQALHAFDADKITGKTIEVKNVASGTKFVTLDDVERTLNEADLMICNAEEPMCLAGVFGGKFSGVTEHTANIFLESAYFNPVSIRKTARRHQLSTDASFRYERGCDPNNTMYVLKRCALLIQEVAGGTIVGEPVDIIDGKPVTNEVQTPFAPFAVTLSLNKTNALIGKCLGEDMIETILRALEINIADKQTTDDDTIYHLEVPRYRTDVQRDCDVIEDILRIYGYNNVEMSEHLNSNLSFSQKPDSAALQRKLSEMLTAQGFNEILNNSLTKTSYYEGNSVYPRENAVELLNPLSADLALMRQTLLYGGLESIQRNVNRNRPNLQFYEFGNCYHYHQDAAQAEEPLKAYSEEMHLGLWLTGNKTAQSWVRAEEKTSFYQLHAYVNNLLLRLGVDMGKLTLLPLEANELFADGLTILAGNGKALGFMTIVNRKLLKQFDIDSDVFYADLDWKALLRQNKQYKPVITDLPKFPEVKRDLALLVDKSVQFADLRKAAFDTERKLLRKVALFDVYEGKTLEAGKKSYALSFTLQDPENTLKDKQIENVMARLQKTFEERFGAKLR